jgi:hypothetical protein
MLTLGIMEVHLKPELRAKVEQAAADNQSAPAEYVQQFAEITLSMMHGSVSR